MASKQTADHGKAWKPGDPLRLDKAMPKDASNTHLTDRLDRAADAFGSQGNKPNHAIKPTNHKPFNRQKKG